VSLLIYTGVSLVLAIIGMRLFYDINTWRDVIPARSDAAFEIATLVLGIGVALFVLNLPWLTPS